MKKILLPFLIALTFSGCILSTNNVISTVESITTNKGELLYTKVYKKEPVVVLKNNKKYYCFSEGETNRCFNKSKTVLYTHKQNIYLVKRYSHIVEITIPER